MYDGTAALLVHVRDITEQKQTQDELERRVAERTDALTQANSNLQQEMVDRMQAEAQARRLHSELAHVARLSTMGEMASGLAHELNQPLGAITNFLRGVVRKIDAQTLDRDELRRVLARTADEAERAGGIIARLRDMVSKASPQREAAEVNQLIREVAELLAFEARQAQVTLTLDLAEPLPRVLADRIQIQQVLLNLMRNAVEAMSGSDTAASERVVTVTTAPRRCDCVCVSVLDRGPGCDDRTLAHLFDAFFTTKAGGMGMGLAISRSIIEAHGGEMSARRREGGGMVFSFTVCHAEEFDHG